MQIKSIRKSAAISMATLTVLALSSCGQGSTTDVMQTDQPLPKVTLAAIDAGIAEGIGDFETRITRSENGYEIAVIGAADLSDREQAFLSVHYDPADFHALGLELPAQQNRDDVLALAVEAQPGRIDTGIVTTRQSTRPAVEAGDVLLQFTLVPGAIRNVVEVADSSRACARNLELEQGEDQHWTLSWDYTNPGDANQDGEVGIQDLTPIGQHFKEAVSNDWDDNLRHVDSDGNGEINASDVTAIGQYYDAEVWAYQLEMSEDGTTDFITVGQLLLNDQVVTPGETVRFDYTFGAQYVESAWYRVVPLNSSLEFGTASESISEDGRRIEDVNVPADQAVRLTAFAQDLPYPIAHLNSVRVVFPASYDYVVGSANPGAPGGYTYTADGIWGEFVTEILFPPDSFIVTQAQENGWKAVELNVSVINGTLPAAPSGYGDLINFQLVGDGSQPLTVFFDVQTPDEVWRTYYTDAEHELHFFGNRIGLRLQ